MGYQVDCRVTFNTQMPGAREKGKKRGRLPFLVIIRYMIDAVLSAHGGQALVWKFQRTFFNSEMLQKISNQSNHHNSTIKLSKAIKSCEKELS